MNKQNSKKLNTHQKTIAAIALIVTVLLAICVTFAWYTNRINVMRGKFSLGSFNYTVTLYDVDQSNKTVTQLQTATYDKQDSDDWSLSSETIGMASNSVKYQLVKVSNNSGFGIKAYEYLTYNEMTAQEAALANYFYFKPYKLEISGNATPAQINSYLSTYTLPSASDISSPSSDITFGTIKNNAVALESAAIEDDDYGYYLLAYCVTGLPNELTFPGNLTVDVNPILTIGQANGPIPQTTASSRVIYADSWQALRSAIASANSGDTIYLTKNIEGPAATNLTMENGVNLNLNTYTLRIHGDLVFNYKTTDARKLTVPATSKLYVDGDIYVNTLGSFSINSTGSSQNVFLGKRENSVVTGGNLYVNAGLSVNENVADPESTKIDDSTGFTLSNIQLVSMTSGGTYAPTDLTVTGSDTMIKLAAGAVLNSIVVDSGHGINDVYIVNNGVVDSIDLGNIDYSGSSLQVGAYVKNNNSVTSLSLKSGSSGAIGYQTNSSDYNTRVINGNGALTAFSGDYNDPYFMEEDIEPFGQQTDVSIVIQDQTVSEKFTVYLKNVDANTGANYEAISALFTTYGFDYTACSDLTVITNNGIQLKPAQFYDIRDNFSGLEKIDFSSAAVQNQTIPNNALDAQTNANMEELKEVVLPITSVTIGNYAFRGTKIEEVTIGSNVNSIGTGAFNVANGVSLEVIWDRSDSVPLSFLSGFDVNKTTIFMDESLAQTAMTGSYTDAWKLSMYEFYEFKAENGNYYCKYSRDGSTTTGCEIIFYAGTIADKAESDLVPQTLNDGQSNYTVVAVKRQAFRKAILADGGATTEGVIVDLSNCVAVGDRAFEGTSAAKLTILPLKLGMVKEIGASAFKNTIITGSTARPNGFGGMVSLGSYAFDGCVFTGGILDLHGPSEKYTPDDYALAGLTFTGEYNTGNAILDLHNVNVFRATIASNASIEADLLLNNSNTIASGAFSGVIEGNDDPPTNIVDARDIKSIGENAFYEIECGTLYLGTNDDDILGASTAYQSIIGATAGNHIGTLVLDGSFVTTTAPALASVTSASEVVTIDTLKIARVTSGNNVVTTEIPAYAFATNATVQSGTFSGRNLNIGAIDTTATEGGNTVYASFNIGADAFRGANFSATMKDFEGVVEIGAEAFAYSSIVNLNLGESISSIANETFIKYCDSIQLLTIETVLPQSDPYDEYVVDLGGSAYADEKFSSTGTKVDGFKISVDPDILTTYLQQNLEIDGNTKLNVWYGWRNYFEPLIHQYSYNGNVWSYYIIDSSGTQAAIDKGVQIVAYDRPNGSGTYMAGVPKTITYDGNTYNVTEFGSEEDILKDLNPNMQSIGFDFESTNARQVLEYIAPESLVSPKLYGIRSGDAAGYRYYVGKTRNTSTLDTGDVVLYRKNVLSPITSSTLNTDIEIVRVFSYSYSIRKAAPTVPTWTAVTATSFTIREDVSRILTGAFNGNRTITSVKVAVPSKPQLIGGTTVCVAPRLNYIESGAFDNSKVVSFDFCNCYDERVIEGNIKSSQSQVIKIGRDALGPARKRVLDNDGYYVYEKADNIQIYVPDVDVSSTSTVEKFITRYQNDSSYYLYQKYGCLQEKTPDGGRPTPNEAGETKTKKQENASLKSADFDVTVGGISYHVMPSGTVWNGATYESANAQYVAVVTGLSAETADAAKVTIPSSIYVKGVEYKVVGITDDAFGKNEVMETLVLPNKEMLFSSATLADCTALESVQYNDILANVEESQSNVASLPVETAKALIEDHSEDVSE